MGSEFGERLLRSLDELLRGPLPCTWAGCPVPATWIATFEPCGHKWAYCDEHKEDFAGWMASATDRLQCADENRTLVLAIGWNRKAEFE